MSQKRIMIFSGTRHTVLAGSVAKKIGIPISDANIQKFANGEVKCQLMDSVRGADVFIFQTHSAPVNDAIMEQAIMIDAAKRASARHITAVCPLLGYARQDRKSHGREPITAKLVTDLLKLSGADRIISIDLHASQIQGFFDGPFDHLIAMPLLADYLQKTYGQDFVVVAPDAGRVKVVEKYGERLSVDIAVVHKQRPKNNEAKITLDVIGDVSGKRCVIIDDMIDTGGTIIAAAEHLKNQGAQEVVAVTSHGLFSSPARERLANSAIDRIIATDTVPNNDENLDIKVVSVVEMLASAILAVYEDGSVSELFNGDNQY